jgi:lipopolysaccharide transport system permease protein
MIAAAEHIDVPHVRVEPTRGFADLDLGALWEYRQLIYFLTWRDVKVRYKQTVLGLGWAVLQPFLTMVVFTVFFGRVADISSEGLPYPIFSFAALLPWFFFSNGVTQSSNSVVASANMITKVYFPRLILPLSAVVGGAVDFCVAGTFLGGMMVYYGIVPPVRALLIPAFFLLAAVSCLGVGTWLAALNVRYRDIRYLVPFITQLWLIATPIAYPATLIHEPWRTIYGLNPLVGVVEGFRWALLGADTAPGGMIGLSTLTAVAVLVSGLVYFRRMEDSFADVV